MKGILFPRWHLQYERNKKPLQDILLEHIGIQDKHEVERFFSPDTYYPHEFYLLKDAVKAVDRIMGAINSKEKIIIFGDYDVDGVVGTSILVELLQKLQAQVSYRIPDRVKDGYGLKNYFLDEVAEKGVTLLVTVDTGITAIKECEHAKDLGIDVIITDHHIPHKGVPKAYAVVNHQQEDCEYPFPHICGAVIAYKIALGIAKRCFSEDEYLCYEQSITDRVALATVADCVPLIGENRYFVKRGLEQIIKTENKGLKSLLDAGNIRTNAVNADIFGFQIGPRINVSGRLASPYIALQLLLGNEAHAPVLEELNTLRKNMIVTALLEADTSAEKNTLIIKIHDTWHSGIIGLIAGKLTEKYFLPSIVLTKKGDEYTASCRAPQGFNMFEFLTRFKDMFTHFGGHMQAAGFSIPKSKLSEFQSKAKAYAEELLSASPLEKSLHIVTELEASDITLQTLNILSGFEPFGIGNPRPVFLLKNVQVQLSRMGADKKHVSGNIFTSSSLSHRCIQFFSDLPVERFTAPTFCNIACTLQKNVWNGEERIELGLIDIVRV